MENKEKVEILDQDLNEEVSPKGKELGIGLILGLSYLLFLPTLVMVILLMFIPVSDPLVWGGDGEYNVLAGIAQTIAGALVIFGMYKVSKPLFKKLFKSFNGATFKNALKFALLAYACVVVANMIDLTIFGPMMDNANQQAVTNLLFDSPIVGCLMTIVLAPVVEELIFRYYIFKGLEKRNIYLAYAITALSFAAIHLFASVGTPFFLQDLRSIPIYTVAGLVFCFAYSKTRNIGVNIGAHMIYNTIATVLIFVLPAEAGAVEISNVSQTGTSLVITIDENEEMLVDVKTMEIHLYDEYKPNKDQTPIQSVDVTSDTVSFTTLTPRTRYIVIITYDMNNPAYGEVGETQTYIDLYTLD